MWPLFTPRANMNAPIRDAFHCSSRKPMRRHFVSGFSKALLSLRHAQKRRSLGSRLCRYLINHSITSVPVVLPISKSRLTFTYEIRKHGTLPKLRARIRAKIRAKIPARIRAKMSFLRYLFSNLSVRLGFESVRLGLFRLVLI